MARVTLTDRRRAGRVAGLLLAVGLTGGLTGCGLAEDAANDAADAATDRVKEEASNAAAAAVEQQICSLVGDGQLSTTEIEALERIVDNAHELGVPRELLDPAHEVVSAGKATTAEVNEIRSNC